MRLENNINLENIENNYSKQKEKILKGIKDIKEGKFSSNDDVSQKARECIK